MNYASWEQRILLLRRLTRAFGGAKFSLNFERLLASGAQPPASILRACAESR